MKKLLLIVVILLLIPLIAMQFTSEVNWKLFDFLFAGVLLFGTGLILIFGKRKIKNIKYRYLFYIVIMIVFLLIYSELAVGIFYL
jgi:hypothetical protein